MKKYISNGRVLREEIAADIRDGVLMREDIKALVSDPDIQKAFIGQNYSKKVSPDKWTQAYLDKLPNATVAEAFNEDYLYYLADVYEYVNRKATRKESTGFEKYWSEATGFFKKYWPEATGFFKKYWPVVLVVVVGGCFVYFAVNSDK